MTKMQKRKCILGYVLLVILTIIVNCGVIAICSAISVKDANDGGATKIQMIDQYAQINNLFYNPTESTDLCEGAGYTQEVTWRDLDRYDDSDVDGRMELLLETYAPFAMDLQRWYGVPWELPFAVMIEESGAGTEPTPDYPNQKAKSLGYYNMMGLTWSKWFGEIEHYEVGHEEYEICLAGQDCQTNNFSYYDSISKMI